MTGSIYTLYTHIVRWEPRESRFENYQSDGEHEYCQQKQSTTNKDFSGGWGLCVMSVPAPQFTARVSRNVSKAPRL